jgi:hypothetical protein
MSSSSPLSGSVLLSFFPLLMHEFRTGTLPALVSAMA